MFEPLQIFYNPWFLFVWGACCGSFLNVVFYRYPLGRSVAYPPSACPNCKRAIPIYDNIPILSWLILWGRCRKCRQKFSPAYAANEAFFGLVAMFPIWLHADNWVAGMSLGAAGTAFFSVAYLVFRHHKAPWYLVTIGLAGSGIYLFQFIG